MNHIDMLLVLTETKEKINIIRTGSSTILKIVNMFGNLDINH
jgi:hypothetical protein